MKERELRALHRAVQPILQRTAPTAAQGATRITPAILDRIAWNVVLAYVANATQPPPAAIPRETLTGEVPLHDEQVRTTVHALSHADVHPRWVSGAQVTDRFDAAARRLLEANGWSAQRAAQAAGEAAHALHSALGEQ